MSMSQDSAETIALQALAWIAGSDDLLPVFLGSTGTAADELRVRAKDADFLASILDFLLMDDAWVVGFCDTAGLRYDKPMLARAALPGGKDVYWT
ncbi:DUF3572 family protein [Aquicoccus porphyridii]|uniref:DUF3572 family protein n=1 Tax=Aquicoccus porphyridii TaxID=1852029 RepID=A0A5A9YYS3_9RHOB|nr:DUF3572 domain-containing protein [Aquicoccus porphyridii]KAA0910101.1 DUF3572 family protein [Aquicoccus porphyridii]RAI53450.1 DUF3572 domain-containing protein [Rhodobacteraceae bacterium AsT-22]